MKLLGDTAADRKRSLGLLATLAVVWPFMVAFDVWWKLGRPGCRGRV